MRCFEAGRDDFLRKPVLYLELRARVRAIVRRTSAATGKRPRRVGALAIDPGALEAQYAGTRLGLSRLEFALLCQLACDPLRVFTKRELLPTCQLESRPEMAPSSDLLLAPASMRQAPPE